MPLAEYRDNLRAIARHVAAASGGATRLLLVTPPPVGEAAWLRHARGRYAPRAVAPDRSNVAAGRYAAACRAVGEELHVPVVRAWSFLCITSLRH